MEVTVSIESNGDFRATVFELPDGRVIVTTNSPPDWAALFRTRSDWEGGNSDLDAIEVYDNVCDAFADIL